MKLRVTAAVAAAVLMSAAVHATGLFVAVPKAPQTLEGGPSQLAMIGNSFEDAVAGTIASSTNPVPLQATDSLSDAVPAVSQPVQNETPPISQVAPVAAPLVQNAANPVVEAADVMASVPAVPNAVPVGPVGATPAAKQPESVEMPSAPPESAETVETTDRIIGNEAPIVQTPTEDTTRPVKRPDRTQTVKRSETSPSEPQTAPSQAGNARDNAKAGETSGQQTGQSNRNRQGTSGESVDTGRASLEYQQAVNRHLSRRRPPSTRFKGSAVVAFTIAGNGAIAAISIRRSSGNSEFDQLALAHIRRSAPFPKPPPGAQRQYNVPVRGR